MFLFLIITNKQNLFWKWSMLHFLSGHEASQPWMHLSAALEKNLKKRKRNESPEGLSCEDGLPQKVNIPIILHCRKRMLQLSSLLVLTPASAFEYVFFLPLPT